MLRSDPARRAPILELAAADNEDQKTKGEAREQLGLISNRGGKPANPQAKP